jgi:hypothetical protein
MFDNPNFFTAQRNEDNPPFSTAISELQTSSTGPISFDAPWSVGSITTSPFPQPQIPTPSQAQFFSQSQYIVMPAHFKTAYSVQWTLSVQRQFGHGWQAQVDYIGNTTRHDPIGYTFDPATFIPGVWGANGTGCTGVVTTGAAAVKPGAAGANCSTTGNQISRFQLTQLNPTQGNQYQGGGGGSVIVGDEGTANYNGLVSSIQHRISSTFSLLGNWTWSKCLNIEDSQGDLAGTTVENINNIMMDYGPCGSDFRHIENISLVTRSGFSRFNGITKALVNGWELAPLVRIQSGEPFTVTSGQDNSLTDVGNDRPNLISGVDPYKEVKFHKGTGVANRGFLNQAAFAQVTAPCTSTTTGGCQYLGTYGNVSRNSFRGPKALNIDAQISRVFQIHEKWSTTLRLEAFNVLNHPNFNPPTGGSAGTIAGNSGSAAVLTSSTFGQVTSTSNQARVFQGAIKVSF